MSEGSRRRKRFSIQSSHDRSVDQLVTFFKVTVMGGVVVFLGALTVVFVKDIKGDEKDNGAAITTTDVKKSDEVFTLALRDTVKFYTSNNIKIEQKKFVDDIISKIPDSAFEKGLAIPSGLDDDNKEAVLFKNKSELASYLKSPQLKDAFQLLAAESSSEISKPR